MEQNFNFSTLNTYLSRTWYKQILNPRGLLYIMELMKLTFSFVP